VVVMFHDLRIHLTSPPVITFYWGYLKGKVFISKPRTIEKLKQKLKEEIAAIPEQMTCHMMENLLGQMEQCLKNGGKHLSDILFKT
jgi:hypothetical protein